MITSDKTEYYTAKIKSFFSITTLFELAANRTNDSMKQEQVKVQKKKKKQEQVMSTEF